jgi:hypothetical protein
MMAVSVSLRPVAYDELMEAADLLENFTKDWDKGRAFNELAKKQHKKRRTKCRKQLF